METLNQQLDKHGRPGAIYSDKHSEDLGTIVLLVLLILKWVMR